MSPQPYRQAAAPGACPFHGCACHKSPLSWWARKWLRLKRRTVIGMDERRFFPALVRQFYAILQVSGEDLRWRP